MKDDDPIAVDDASEEEAEEAKGEGRESFVVTASTSTSTSASQDEEAAVSAEAAAEVLVLSDGRTCKEKKVNAIKTRGKKEQNLTCSTSLAKQQRRRSNMQEEKRLEC